MNLDSSQEPGNRAKPVYEIKLARIRASVWANVNARQATWYRVTIARLYKDGETWNETTSFGRDDLPLVVKAAEMAYAWIWSQLVETQEQDRVRR